MSKAVFAGLLTAVLALAGPAAAQVGADLNISPKRLSFKPGDRAATVYIFNQGDTRATYTIDMVDRVMLDDGQIVPAADRPDRPVSSAQELVQYTPRRITLEPRQSQSIRVRVRPSDTAGPEQRSHLTVTALPPESVGLTAAQAAQPAPEEVALQVVALFSVSIPVIVREGEIDGRAAIENARVALPPAGGAAGISLDLVRLGANSVYGDVEVYSGEGRGAELVGAVRGVAVYPEIQRRTVFAPITGQVARGEKLRVVYRDDDAHPKAELASVFVTAP